MYTFTVKATSMSMLKDKLLEAANSIEQEAETNKPAEPKVEEPTWNTGLNEVPAEKSPFPGQAPTPGPIQPPPTPSIPVPVSPNPIPTPPAAHMPSAGPVGELDSQGLPWDERIHSEKRSKNADGSWRSRRKIESGVIRQVEAELRARVASSSGTQPAPSQQPVQQSGNVFPMHGAPPIAIAPSSVQVQPPSFTAAPPVQQAAASPLPNYENIPQPTETRSAHNLDTFKANIIPTFASLVKEGKITQEYIQQLKEYFQVKEIWEVANDQAKLAELYESFCKAGLITKVA